MLSGLLGKKLNSCFGIGSFQSGLGFLLFKTAKSAFKGLEVV